MSDKLFPGHLPMKPILILPLDSMGDADIKLLNDNGICTVVCKDPAAVKFLDPIPSADQRGKVEQAAIKLSRKILNRGYWGNTIDRGNIAALYVDLLCEGTELDPNIDKEKEVYDYAKVEEIRKIAREEARAERAKKKEQQEKEKKK